MFGFSLTLLVVSLEVPRTFSELMILVYGFLLFALSFTLFVHIWYLHSRYFKRYGLEDVPTIWLNSILLFLVMFFVYPLKFLVSVVVKALSGDPLTVPGDGGSVIPMLTWDDSASMLLLFSAGYIAIQLTFVVMYIRAFRLRQRLELNELEVFDTKTALGEHVIYVLVGVTSVTIGLFGGSGFVTQAGWFYALLGPIMGVYGYTNGRRRDKLERSLSA